MKRMKLNQDVKVGQNENGDLIQKYTDMIRLKVDDEKLDNKTDGKGTLIYFVDDLIITRMPPKSKLQGYSKNRKSSIGK